MENTNETTNKKKPARLLLIGLAAIVLAGAGYYFWQRGAAYESTDNAQLDSDILPARAEITGKIDRIYFIDNQQVKKGDTLIAFQTEELRAKVLQAEAALENAKANVKVGDVRAMVSSENANASVQNSSVYQQGIIAAKANLDKAQKDYNRMDELVKAKAATQEQYEAAQTRLTIAKSDYEKAVNQQRSAAASSSGLRIQEKVEQTQVSASQAMVKQREAELLQAQQQLDHAYIIAPFDGIVTKRTVQQSQYVAVGTSLCTVIDDNNLWVTANFKETQLSGIRIGQHVAVKIDAFPGMQLDGIVASFGGATGAKFSLIPPDNASGNFIKVTQRFPVRIQLISLPKNKPTGLFAGLSAFVKVKIS